MYFFPRPTKLLPHSQIMKSKILPVVLLILILIAQKSAMSQYNAENSPLIPEPRSLQLNQGSFQIKPTTIIYYNDTKVSEDIRIFNDYLQKSYGFHLKTARSNERKINHLNINFNPDLAEDNYKLTIDSEFVEITGGKNGGVFYALQSLIELLPPGSVRSIEVPCLTIEDGPRFKYRGMHLDVARHFFSVQSVKKYIDHLAQYKMNFFHWHLTDDQGWRIEIKKYPKLQEIGAWRKGTLIGHFFDKPENFDSIPYGGFYTREEIRDVVQYASDRHITIIPEIEMPGHALAALASYPEYSCTGGPFEVGKTWGVYKDVFCPKEETFTFLEGILDEVCNLFPGKYIHIGGDECPKDRWKNCTYCQKLIKKENLNDENGLQQYFTNRISLYLKSKNKIAIGWDEILDDKLDSNAAIMSWRGYAGGIKAAQKGHDVVMNPYTHCYFDSYESRNTDGKIAIGGYLPLDMVYRFEPVPDGLSNVQASHIIGAQGNLWSEYITTDERLNEMAFPRMCALSEVLWTPKEKRNYAGFVSRLVSHFKFLYFNKINYSNALFDISSKVSADSVKGINIELYSKYPGGNIYYTLDGTNPTIKSELYYGKISVDQSINIHAALFETLQQKGKIFNKIFYVNNATGKKIILAYPPHTEYAVGGASSLVDGFTGDLPWLSSEWIGFSGKDLDAVIDLGVIQNVSRISIDVLKEEAGKIFLPRQVIVKISDDGENYKVAASLDFTQISQMKRKLILRFPPVKARWVKVFAQNYNSKDWLFVDEIFIE